ncbi:hypothetical protein Ccrd_026865 [Cynara cardunculus var. scolymus]|uniref:Uncharacterized protein n=1 Tax=Cynara cardunculus var. scolymus TaxID=59895 RepID=A0A103IBA2_CYNCS|nr:hypothetical protein Ccrd_026865 [Cynara cardunculus var. scolymus]
MLAKGFVMGKDALRKAQSFDEKNQFTTSASTTYASLDRKIGLTKNLSMGRAVVNEKMKALDERYQVSEATKSAIAVAEQKAASASNALMRNHYVSSGVLMVSNALSAFAKAAEDEYCSTWKLRKRKDLNQGGQNATACLYSCKQGIFRSEIRNSRRKKAT